MIYTDLNPTMHNLRKLEQYCGNVALKINTKLGGTTAQLRLEAPFLENKHFMVRTPWIGIHFLTLMESHSWVLR